MEMWQEFLKYFTIDNGMFIALVMFGMFSHAAKKFFADELTGSINDYIFRNNPKRTALAIFTGISAAVGIILAEQLPTQVGAFILMAVTTGYTADSSVNKDSGKIE